ncbi:hypothetical protein DPMN_150630 [Dreissena polymorpha]|uniref:Uncharacterized protein n=1 Tax=Dreissena polymorpha TaxID=45954 RepID=A0A9D4FIC4_DREPO|nr:hypothetical protein DPMN_150630 [Dreissena polymorpha]
MCGIPSAERDSNILQTIQHALVVLERTSHSCMMFLSQIRSQRGQTTLTRVLSGRRW